MIYKLKDPPWKDDLTLFTDRNWHVVTILVSLPVIQVQLTLPNSVFRMHVRFCGISGGSEKEVHNCVMHEILLQSFKDSTLPKLWNKSYCTFPTNFISVINFNSSQAFVYLSGHNLLLRLGKKKKKCFYFASLKDILQAMWNNVL